MEQTHERAHKKRGLLWLLLFALIICGLGAYFYFQKDPVPIISADLLPEAGDATDQRLSERAQESGCQLLYVADQPRSRI